MPDRTFEYMLNRLERAAQAEKPAEAGYAFARNEILRYVRGLEALRDDVRTLQIAANEHVRVIPDADGAL